MVCHSKIRIFLLFKDGTAIKVPFESIANAQFENDIHSYSYFLVIISIFSSIFHIFIILSHDLLERIAPLLLKNILKIPS